VRLAVGPLLIAVAFAAVLRAHLGLGPWHVLQQGLADHLGITLGQAGWVSAGTVMVVAMVLGELPGPGTVIAMFVGGLLIDAVMPHIGTPTMLAGRFGFLLGGLAVMSLGGSLMISARLGTSPLDALMTGIYRRTPFRISSVRLGLEVLGLALGWAAGGEVGVGCVVIGLGIGPCIQAWLGLLGAIPPKLLDPDVDPGGRFRHATA
jgi:uncharacterized membrane protein YczE